MAEVIHFAVNELLHAGVKIEFQPNLLPYPDVDVLVNSANGGLIHGGGMAAEISRASGECFPEYFDWLVKKMPGELGEMYRELRETTELLKPTYLQMGSLLLISKFGGPLKQGQAVVAGSGEIGKYPHWGPERVVHAVGMTYDFASPDRDEAGMPPVIPATEDIVTTAIEMTLATMKGIGWQSLAVPQMCVGRGGLATWEQSLQAILKGIQLGIEDGAVLEKLVIIGEDQWRVSRPRLG